MRKEKYGAWVIVTGASRGIGKAFAELLASEGYNVVLLARDRVLLEAVAAKLRNFHQVETRIVVADLADPDSLIETLEQQTSDLDIGLLIANAAVSQFAQVHVASPDDMLTLLRINVLSTAILCQYFARRLVARGGGGIMPVSSNGAYCMMPNQANYAAPRPMWRTSAEILHFELKARNVDVTTLFPPAVDSDMNGRPDRPHEWEFKRMPFGFGVMAEAKPIARAA